MSIYRYTAYDSHGTKIQGEISADDLAQAKLKVIPLK